MNTLLVIDDFYPAPKALATTAKTLTYEIKKYKGHDYNGVGTGFEPENIWTYLSMAHNQRVYPEVSFFRLGIASEQLNTYIHADAGSAVRAAVLYLSELPDGTMGGTAMWKHKETGLSATPTSEWVRRNIGDSDEAENGFWKKINQDGNDESKWQMTDLVGQRFNRLVSYPTSQFHSRYPQNGWGDNASNGRLTWATFMNFL